jgi:hypothetical protein
MTFPEMIHGAKPEVAPFEATNPIEELMKLLTGEIKDWPQIQKLGDMFQSDVFQKMSQAGLDLKSLISAGGENAAQTLKNALSLQKGIMPDLDLKANLRGSAFQNLSSGLLGSMAGTANSLRNVGLGAYEAMKQGVGMASEAGNAVQRWMGISQGTMLPASSQLYSPEWFSQFMAQQRAAKQATKQFQNNVNAAPDPVVSGIAGTVMNLVGAYLGAGRGGGGNMLGTTDYTKLGAGGYAGTAVNQGSNADVMGGVVGGTDGPGGNYGGTSIYNATTGGWNTPWGTNVGGTDIPYIGGNVSTPSGASYGQGSTPVAPPPSVFNSTPSQQFWGEA